MRIKTSYFDGLARLVECHAHADLRGILRSFEFDLLPFVPRRIFTVSAVSASCMRGGHAHKTGEQMLICVQGRIETLMRWQGLAVSVTLEPTSEGLVFGPGVWCQQKYLTNDSVLLVLASEPYDPQSYVYEWT